MKKPRPSNIVISVVVSIFALLVLFAIGALIYHASKQVRESDEGIGERKQEFLN